MITANDARAIRDFPVPQILHQFDRLIQEAISESYFKSSVSVTVRTTDQELLDNVRGRLQHYGYQVTVKQIGGFEGWWVIEARW